MRNLLRVGVSPDYKRIKDQQRRTNRIFKTYNIDGISSDNEYVPIFAPKMNLGIYDGKIVHYSVPRYDDYVFVAKTYNRLYSSLCYNSVPFYFKTSSMEEYLKAIKGMIFKEILGTDKINILFLIAVRTEYMKQMYQETDALGVPRDLSKFAIILSKEFYMSAQYKTMHNKMQREIIKPLIEQGVELIITNNIEKKCFSNNVTQPKFKTVTELQQYLVSFNQAI